MFYTLRKSFPAMSCAIFFVSLIASCNLVRDEKSQSWAIVGSPSDSLGGIAFLIDKNDMFLLGGYQGLYRSVDKGESWTREDSDLPGDPDFYRFAEGKTSIFAGSFTHLFESVDGESWNILSDLGQHDSFVSAIAENINGTMYFSRKRGYLYKSTDSGTSWDSLNAGSASAIRFNSQNEIFYGGWFCGEVRRSTNGGDDWESFQLTDYCSYSTYALEIDTDDVVFAGTTKGVFRSTDNGEKWSLVGDFGPVYAIYIDTTNRPFVANTNGEVYYSNDHGETWVNMHAELPIDEVWVLDADRSGFLYARTQWMGLYRSPKSIYEYK